MRAVRGRRVVVAVAMLAAACAAPAGANPRAPMSADQPLKDGCLRSNFGIGFDTAPEWVYVYRSPAIRMAQGVVRVAHVSLADSILEHRSFDSNANLVPDPAFRYLIAGDPKQHTGNFAPGGGEELGRLHFEWESLTLPPFAWPTDGDRATLWGSWIWDCGHWTSTENNTSGVVTGEHSELHPLSAIAVSRAAPYLSARSESQTDVFVSNQGDASHAIEKCALSHHPQPGAAYPQDDAGFKPCAMARANQIQPLARRYSFFVPAPPRPSAASRLHVRIVKRISGGSGSERVRLERGGAAVTVTLQGGSRPVAYGKSFFASWTGPVRQAPVRLKVTLKSILIRQADPNPAVPDPSGAHWVLYLDLNGYWKLINDWAPGLARLTSDGQRFAINRTVTIYVPQHAGVWVQMAGHECDEPAGVTILGILTNLLYPCPANTDERNPDIFKIFSNDDTGTVLDTYRSATAALGTHVSQSVATTHGFPGSGPISFGDGKQGQGNYELTYTVRRG